MTTSKYGYPSASYPEQDNEFKFSSIICLPKYNLDTTSVTFVNNFLVDIFTIFLT